MSAPQLAELPARAPQQRRRWLAAIGRAVLRLGGWNMRGEWPAVDKLLVIVAPHSSAWDGLWGLACKAALGVDIKILAKAELFQGLSGVLLGPLLRWLGAVPVDRHAPQGLVEQTVAQFQAHSTFWLILAPEGTRRKVERWRSGFWHIARAAEVPVLCAYFHYPERIIGLGPVIQLSADLDADMARIRDYYRPFVGHRRGTV